MRIRQKRKPCSSPAGLWWGLLSQTLIVHMIRTRRLPFIQSRAAWPLMTMTLLGDGGRDLVAVFAAGVLPAIAGAAAKLFSRG
ncbi:magnesium-transporting ATPase MgtA [Salmonella enterica subsp. arizonae]|uniref:Magnesium-transporting ATPase MgtA n=1 Tax=Salmonella enterica subsp. arizonae TaxID=59203 RepID=A0A379TGW9_SALER|nr:magnesium-transporting ATPase MgtA [Salmonella enterica subsp. arizonae]